jgi:aminopeptidase N
VRLSSLGADEPATIVLPKDGATATVSVPGCGPVVVNAGHAGYFRTQYGAAEFARLREGFGRVADVDRLGILNDTWALGAAARIPAASYLELAAAVPDDADPLVLRQVAATFATVDQLLDGSREQDAWRKYARTTLRPMFDRIGWLPAAGESESTALLRETLIRTLGRLEDRHVIAEARRRFARARKDPGALPAAIREAVIPVVARHADALTWNEIRARANAALEPIEKERLYSALGWTVDPVLAERALAFSLSNSMPEVFATNIVQAVALGHPELAFEFAVKNETAVLDLVEGASRWAFIPSLASTSDDLAMAGKVHVYTDRSVPADARQAAERAVAEISARVRSKEKLVPALEAWVRGG